MVEWIKKNLLKDNGYFNSNRLKPSWFLKNGYENELKTILEEPLI